MPEYRLSARAAGDIAGIADYTIEQFGVNQARRYRDGLETCFSALAENPLLGRSTEELAPNLKRFEHGSHVVFYQARERGVLIVRVLHESMDAPSHF
jgi:toxin ParE1/3/4